MPLQERRGSLTDELKSLHKNILIHYLRTGRAPLAEEVSAAVGIPEGFRRLADARLIVIDESGQVTGAYPFTSERREHRVFTSGIEVRAMCAIDALAVSPMFGVPSVIRSECRVSGAKIHLQQNNTAVEVSSADSSVYAAINWGASQSGAICAATLCTEMIFMVGDENCEHWLGRDPDCREIFDLEEAIALGFAIFKPLMC